MTVPDRPDHVRASDVDRKAVQDRLHWAHAEGVLTLAEFDSRVRSAWDAKTRAELAELTVDLPEPPRSGRRPLFAPTDGGMAMRVLSTVWLSLTVANLMIWGILALTVDSDIHPWWLWVAGPPGGVLLVLYLSGIGRPRSDT